MSFGLNSGSVNGGLAQLLISFCQLHSLPIPEACLQYAPASRIPFNVWQQILSDMDAHYQKAGLGLAIADLVQPSHIGIMGYLSLACQTLGEALSRFANYHRLAYDGNDMQVETLMGGSHPQLKISWGVSLGKPGQLVDETAIAVFTKMAARLIQPAALVLDHIAFVNPKPKNLAIYQTYFGCKVQFNAERTSVIFPLSQLAAALNHADPTLKLLLDNQAAALLAELPPLNQFEARLQQYLMHAIHHGDIQIDNMADKMGLSVRGLQRELQQRGESFQQRVAQVRETLAKQYLQDAALSLTDIALLLAYSEQSAFQRAFKQWTGHTPYQWRQQQRHEHLQQQTT
jgi:AraC-like DNA-binding protein